MDVTFDGVTIRKQARQSLVLRATPEGLVAFIPRELDPAGETGRCFIERDIACLPAPEYVLELMTSTELDDLIAAWAGQLDIEVGRAQL